jgi:FMN phosphatase YigB (HAD superfamily)
MALAQLAGIAPQEVVFLDDYQANVDAARALGWQGITVGPDLAAVIAELDDLLAR